MSKPAESANLGKTFTIFERLFEWRILQVSPQAESGALHSPSWFFSLYPTPKVVKIGIFDARPPDSRAPSSDSGPFEIKTSSI